MSRNATRTYDAALLLKDSYAVAAASAAGQVASVDKILDIGSGWQNGVARIEVSAMDVATGDEIYTVALEFSNSATFASGIVRGAMLQLGDAAVVAGDIDLDAGRYELPFTNEIDGTLYRYMRTYTNAAVAGSSITHTVAVFKH